MDGIAAVQARIQEIQSQFGLGTTTPGGVLGASDPTATSSDPTSLGADTTSSSGSFADALASGAEHHGHVRQRPDELGFAEPGRRRLGPVGPRLPHQAQHADHVGEREGHHRVGAGRGHQGLVQPVGHDAERASAGETQFNSVGVKNYATYQDGIDANVHALMNGRYTNILDALQRREQRDRSRARRSRTRRGARARGVLRVLQSQQ